MSNFSFIMEVEIDSECQKDIQEFYEHAKNAEKCLYSRPDLAVARIREGAMLLCKTLFDVPNVNKENELAGYTRSEVISKLPLNSREIVLCIEKGTRREVEKTAEHMVELLKYLQDLAKIVYSQLGGDVTQVSFRSDCIEGEEKAKEAKCYFAPEMSVREAFGQVRNEYQNKRNQYNELNALYTETFGAIHDEISGIVAQMKSIEEKIVYKEEFEKISSVLTSKVENYMNLGKRENLRLLEELSAKLRELQVANSKQTDVEQDILSKIIIIMDRMEVLDKKQDKYANTLQDYAKYTNKNMQNLIDKNKEQLHLYGQYTKVFFQKVVESIKTVSDKMDECQKNIVSINNRFETMKPQKVKSKVFHRTNEKVVHQEKATSKIAGFLKSSVIDKQKKYNIFINVIWFSIVAIWLVCTYVFYEKDMFSQALVLVKCTGIIWYFGAWVLYWLGVVSMIWTVIQSIANILIHYTSSIKLTRKRKRLLCRWFLLSLTMLLLGIYVRNGFYIVIMDYYGWKNILLSKETEDIVFAIRNVIDFWRVQ